MRVRQSETETAIWGGEGRGEWDSSRGRAMAVRTDDGEGERHEERHVDPEWVGIHAGVQRLGQQCKRASSVYGCRKDRTSAIPFCDKGPMTCAIRMVYRAVESEYTTKDRVPS